MERLITLLEKTSPLILLTFSIILPFCLELILSDLVIDHFPIVIESKCKEEDSCTLEETEPDKKDIHMSKYFDFFQYQSHFSYIVRNSLRDCN